jgi:5-oxoprolinase (ATP-hydrolysing)
MQAMETLRQSARAPEAPGWQFWIDRGGTFTDVIGLSPAGALHVRKVPSAAPAAAGGDPGLNAAAHILRACGAAPARVTMVKVGTTVATNALLERRGERTVLVITRGFRDALRIGNQSRPRLFERHIVLPELMYERVIEAHERVGAGGEVIAALDEEALAAELHAAYGAGIRACAIVFLHGFRHAAHELAAEALALAAGYTQVSVSHRVSPLMKLVPRGDTTVVDAYLSPILRRYVDQVAAELAGVRLYFMQSNGGLADAAGFQGKDAILSGPAGGIVGAARTAAMAGLDQIIGFDMGGTSTDVALYAGGFERAFETAVAELTLKTNADALRNFCVRIPASFLGPAMRAKHMIVVTDQSGKNARIPIQSLAIVAIIAFCLLRCRRPSWIYEDAPFPIGSLQME